MTHGHMNVKFGNAAHNYKYDTDHTRSNYIHLFCSSAPRNTTSEPSEILSNTKCVVPAVTIDNEHLSN